jgi:hypothetical protein
VTQSYSPRRAPNNATTPNASGAIEHSSGSSGVFLSLRAISPLPQEILTWIEMPLGFLDSDSIKTFWSFSSRSASDPTNSPGAAEVHPTNPKFSLFRAKNESTTLNDLHDTLTTIESLQQCAPLFNDVIECCFLALSQVRKSALEDREPILERDCNRLVQ